ncbi:HlyD family efflux transporter periplasmic adaptor subunit [Verrucomicrobiales bacterium]|nr:HlyD family efflux transporter periplasmic adaptor subunit [Verrucomicrobiales bacterium]
MSDYQPKKTQLVTGRSRYVTRRIFESWPLLIWLFMLAIVIYGYKRGVEFKRMNGTVGVYQEAISAADEGRILEILVQPGDQLEVGQVVARLDPLFIDKRIEKLQRKITASRDDRIRKFRKDVVDLQNDIREIQFQKDEDETEQQMLTQVAERLESSAASRFPEAVARQRLRLEKLNKRIPLYDNEAGFLQTQLAETRKLLQEIMDDPQLTDGADGTDLLDLQILFERKSNLELKTSVSGGVYRIEKEPGEYVRAGETVVRVVAAPNVIIGFLPQEEQGRLAVGDTVWVSSTNDRHTPYATDVTSISPRVSNTPDRASPLPNKMLRGREITLNIPEGLDLLPGQTVIIHVDEPGGLPFIDQLMQFK